MKFFFQRGFNNSKAVVVVLLICLMLFSSCATILTPRYQKVEFQNPEGGEILVDGEEPNTKKGQYALKRDKETKHIVLKKDGYKEVHKTVMQYKYSPWRIMSFVPFGVLIPVLFLDTGEKAFNYSHQIEFDKDLVKIPQKTAQEMNIRLNNVSANIEASEMQYQFYPTYKRFIKERNAYESKGTEEIEVENTVFSSILNDILKDNGFIDTSNKVLNTSYSNNLYLNAAITNLNIKHVRNINQRSYGSLIAVDIEVEWELLDYYRNKLLTVKTSNTSGQFPLESQTNFSYVKFDQSSTGEKIRIAAKDALEYGLIEVLQKSKVRKELKAKDREELKKNFDPLKLPANNFVSDASEAIKSSVTINLEEGHGSGFFVSNEGHIITNYHVIKDTNNIQIITNNKVKYQDVDIIRTSQVNDLALLKIEPKNKTKPIKIIDSEEDLKVANTIFAVGTPSGQDLGQTVSKGIISGLRKTESKSKLIQTDASINAGNSGGALVYENGQAVGVVSYKLMGFGVEGVAFGVPGFSVLDGLNIEQ